MRFAKTLVLTLVCSCASAAALAQPLQVLAHFKRDMGSPRAKLLLASDGYLYGTTSLGGEFGQGSVFRIHPNGTGFQTVSSFSTAAGPNAELIELAGFIYGTAQSGGGAGVNQSGIVFRIDLANVGGSVSAPIDVVHRFDYQDPANGGFPSTGLLALNGVLYGTTESGGANDAGTVFVLDPSSSPPAFSIVHSFGPAGSAPTSPVGTLIEANGQLYGVTKFGGAHNSGALFRIDILTGVFQIAADLQTYPHGGLLKTASYLYGTTQQGGNGDGSVYRFDPAVDALDTIHYFDRTSGGAFPVSDLMLGANGRLYGTTDGGGVNGHGAVFEMDIATDPPTVVTLHSFDPATTGSRPAVGLVQAGALLYGTTSYLGPGSNGTVYSINPVGGAVSVLHSFGPTGPVRPTTALTEVGGSFFGTSYTGGTRQSGTIFKWDPATSAATVIHSFDGQADGAFPQAPLTVGSDGRLYGTTTVGGPTTCGPGCTTQFGGMAFAIRPDGSGYTVLRSFTDPYAPHGRLVEAGGLLYGVLAGGGAHQVGAVFRMDLTGGAYQILHEFDPATDGSTPVAGLTLGSDGLLYGTTNQAGQHGFGTAFRMDPSGGGFQVLHAFDFTNPFDGAIPETGLVQVGPSLFMGTATSGGLYGVHGAGIVYTLDVSTSPATFTSVRSFEQCCINSPFGAYPRSTLLRGAGGWLYGMNEIGTPAEPSGTIYAIDRRGTTRLLHGFTFGDGAGPKGGLTLGADGSLYGTTEGGGTGWGGVVFRFRIDSDGDQVLDPLDNCPTFANPSQADSDGDGIGDGCPVNTPQLPTAQLAFGPLSFTYDGTPKSVAVTVSPAIAGTTGTVTVTYDGSPTPPTNAGTYTVVASLTNPSFSPTSVTAQMYIGPATPVITWNNPADIFFFTPLSATQLDATANVPGSFAYTPGAGTVLPVGNGQLLSVFFTPTDAVNYTTAAATVSINVRGLTVADTTPPVVTAHVDASVLATELGGARGHAIYYPWVGVPIPTLADFLASATATDDLSQPVQLPTELRNCTTGALIDADVDATTLFPLGANVNCVRFSFQDAAGNVGHITRTVTVHPGALAKSQTAVNATTPQGFPSGVTVEFDQVTAPGTVGATCSRNGSSTAPADIQLAVHPTVTCPPLPDGTPRNCFGPAPPPPYTIDCDVSTTAQYSGPIKVCFLVTWGAHQVLHFNAALNQWEDVTIRPVSSTLPYICGSVSSLSPFLINTAPELSLPPNVVAEASNAAGAVVTYTAAATDAEEGVVPATCAPASGSVFPRGATLVSCTATDASGLVTPGSFVVTVLDTTPPVLTVPPNVTTRATTPTGGPVSFVATAADAVDGTVPVTCTPSAGATFPNGSTTVSCTAKDAAGNTATGGFTVTIVPLADVDGSGAVTCADVSIVKASYGKRAGQPGYDSRADVNGDRLVNILDLSIVTRELPAGTKCP